MSAMQVKPGSDMARHHAFGESMNTHPPFFSRTLGITLPVWAIAAVFAAAACNRERNGDDGEPRPAPVAPTTSPNVTTASATQDTTAVDWKVADQAMGRPGKAQPGGV